MGRYKIESRLGEGAMAVVYRAVDTQLDRRVALKVLKHAASERATMKERFIREGRIAARLSHPNIVILYDAQVDEGQLVLAMELVEGRSLDHHFSDPLPERIRILEKVARGVHHAHEHGVVHRDLKPANILVTTAGEPKIADFGLAHLAEAHSTLTQSGSAIGTPLYMAPEQLEGGSKRVTARADVYALGAILYEALTGRPPHIGQTTAEVYGRVLNEEPVPPRKLDPSIPQDLETICLKCLEKNPFRRYAGAHIVADELARHLRGEPIESRPASSWSRIVQKVARNRPLVAAILTLAAAIVTGAVLLNVQGARADRKGVLLQKLSTTLATITERKRELRTLKTPGRLARAELAKAVAEVDPIIAEWPGGPIALYVRARGRLYLGDLDGALADVREALNRNPDFRPGWTLLGAIKVEEYNLNLLLDAAEYRSSRRVEGALVEATAAFERGGTGEPFKKEMEKWGLPVVREDEVMERVARAARSVYGDRNIKAGVDVLEEGLRVYQSEDYALYIARWAADNAYTLKRLNDAVAWAPGFGEALFDRANLHRQLGNFPGAIADYDRAIQLNEDFAAAYNNRGVAKSRSRDHAGALADFKRALELRKDFYSPYTNRGMTYFEMGRMAEAVADFDRAIALHRGVPPHMGRGRVRFAEGNHAGAIEDFTRVIELDPEDEFGFGHRGEVKFKMGDLPGAFADFNSAIAIRETTEFLFIRGSIRYAMGHPREAIGDYDRALELRTANRGNVFNNRANAKLAIDDVQGAIADYDQAIAVEPDIAPSYLGRANARMTIGQFEKAIPDYDKALELQKGLYDALAARGFAHLSLDKPDAAILDLRKALELAPAKWRNREKTERWLQDAEKRIK